MARTFTKPPSSTGSQKRLAAGLLESVTSLWVLCAKRAIRISRKLRVENSTGSPRSPKQLLVTISNKAIQFRLRKKRSCSAAAEEFEIEAGDGELWQRTILMGDKCQPLDFSGVIYYDNNGNQLSELPLRSPRLSPLPSYVYAKRD
ncbi:hypothetical protein LOK49_LG14G00290 [Camellia lanceoleosa]|uniref:Uncharacterized protein n=1 Tax=Camellia lanceoleosa TaxID=1840588 RepID=A0ACC0FCB3_9ERIC|nr:hypothetical protein LOK49_LG14G00290 [Camellia lanceoleosa]